MVLPASQTTATSSNLRNNMRSSMISKLIMRLEPQGFDKPFQKRSKNKCFDQQQRE
jgi:hypothetical protein